MAFLKLGKKEKYCLLIAVAAITWVTGVLCARLLFSAYTSGDDGYTAFAAVADKGIWGSAVEMAKFQGRFYQLLVYPIAMLPFTSESIVVENLFKIYTFLVFLAGLYVFLRETLGWRNAIGCVALFLCLFDTVGGSYNPFHGLPLWFGLGCGLLLFSLALHSRCLRVGQGSGAAYFLYALALLSYEIVIFYAPLFVLMTWLRNGREAAGLSVVAGILRAIRESWQLVAYVAGYLALYLIFRHFYPGTYSGADGLTMASASVMAKPVIGFSIHSLYLKLSYIGAKAVSLNSLAYAAIGVLAVGVGLYMGRNNPVETGGHPRGALLILLAYVFIPNVLFGFTERYRIWAGDGVQFYLGSLYSAVPLTILIYLGLRKVVRVVSEPLSGGLIIGTLVALLGIATYANSKNSENFFAQSRLMASRWNVADWVVEKIKQDEGWDANLSTLCGTGFTHSTELPVYFRNPDMIADVEIYWSRYFSRELGRQVRYVSDPRGVEGGCNARLKLSYKGNSAGFVYGKRLWKRKLRN